MTKYITEKLFYKFLTCNLWPYWELFGDQKDDPHDHIIDKLIDDSLLPEQQRELLKDKKEMVEVTIDDLEEASNQTMELMHQGVQTILHGVLMDGQYVGRPDILEKVRGTSEFGNYQYIAIDIKRGAKVFDAYKFQAAFYAFVLQRIQGEKPVNGYVMNPKGEISDFLLEEVEEKFSLQLADIEHIVAGNKPAPFLTSGCKQSPWFKECLDETLACDSLSGLNRISRVEREWLEDLGITTIKQLAETDIDDISMQQPAFRKDRLWILNRQARTILSGQHSFIDNIIFPEVEVELHFDIESDPLRDIDYLFGVLEVRGNEAKYHHFLARAPEEEEVAWKEFCDFIEQYPEAPIYHYGWYETQRMEKLIEKYGASEESQRIFKKNMKDMLEIMREAILFPSPFYSLKDVAHYTGFKWRHPEAGGVKSVIWYHLWLAEGDEKVLNDILEYNEDDTRATWEVKKWLIAEA